MFKQLWATKHPHAAHKEAEGLSLRRTLGPWGLTALGIGAVIGGGIFVITGTAAANHAGPAIMLSFLLAAICCAFCALAYAEFASMVPVSGSAYTYTYATFGELSAWFIGWMLVLEYGVSASAVAVSWTGYFLSFLSHFDIHLPVALVNAPLDAQLKPTGAIANLPAAVLVLLLTWLCYVGIRKSSAMNMGMVILKTGLILLVIFAGWKYVDTSNWTPFIPANEGPGKYGFEGVLRGAAMVFFAYIGFEAVSVAAQESHRPQRDMPIGMLLSLVVCTVLYIAMAAVMTGLVPYTLLGTAEPVVTAVAAHAHHRRGRRADRLGLGGAGDGDRPAAHLHDHGPRRPAAAGFHPDPPQVPHPAHQHRHHRYRHRAAGGAVPAGHPRRADLDGHADRLCRGLRRRAGAAPYPAGPSAPVPYPDGMAGMQPGRDQLHRPAHRHDRPQLDADGRVDRRRFPHLFPLRHPSQQAPRREHRQGRLIRSLPCHGYRPGAPAPGLFHGAHPCAPPSAALPREWLACRSCMTHSRLPEPAHPRRKNPYVPSG
jgi:hypothetical protein